MVLALKSLKNIEKVGFLGNRKELLKEEGLASLYVE